MAAPLFERRKAGKNAPFYGARVSVGQRVLFALDKILLEGVALIPGTAMSLRPTPRALL